MAGCTHVDALHHHDSLTDAVDGDSVSAGHIRHADFQTIQNPTTNKINNHFKRHHCHQCSLGIARYLLLPEFEFVPIGVDDICQLRGALFLQPSSFSPGHGTEEEHTRDDSEDVHAVI